MHSDLNPKNLLVDPDTLDVTGVLDWEFAHAGHPFTDLGNLLRFDRDPAFVEAVLAAYPTRRGDRAGRPAGPGPGGRPVGAGGPGRPARRTNPVADAARDRAAAADRPDAATCTLSRSAAAG